ncbi:DUF1315 family protein [Endozoicomonas sp. SM1973]|uniref:DUF1315 family protein n=1 Tax=Spartinivicinus marinus TaxID=2994442 RepID=A0A853IGU0_9GAMM|nr:DUF1315 family protein [Spartinivicinus marinus]MCX4024946.1 DUF1315 family protein [Spartinivicinus marinus]NYZ69234.1 DUF1315 family protein [Spartinivicinus marinus]
MQFEKLISQITPDIYQNLKQAVEIGRWPNGQSLTSEQRELSLQAVIAYEAKHLPEDQRTGFMPVACKSQQLTSADTIKITQ